MEAQNTGWYLYGILSTDQISEHMQSYLANIPDASSLQVLAEESLAAIVRPVSLDDFGVDILRRKLQDENWVRTQALHHASIIAAIYQYYAFLPAKFGCVYPDMATLRQSIRESQVTYLSRLHKVNGCDEWEVRMYVNRSLFQQQSIETSQELAALEQEISLVSPGRAYLLQRKKQSAINILIDHQLYQIKEACYNRLIHAAVEGYAVPVSEKSPPTEEEILRVCLLIQRDKLEPFREITQDITLRYPSINSNHIGPWPPYSFVASTPEEKL